MFRRTYSFPQLFVTLLTRRIQKVFRSRDTSSFYCLNVSFIIGYRNEPPSIVFAGIKTH
jgi:hypothetical protein